MYDFFKHIMVEITFVLDLFTYRTIRHLGKKFLQAALLTDTSSEYISLF